MKIAVAFLVATVVAAVLALLNGALLMWAVDIVHAHWISAVPTIGAVLLAFLVSMLFVRPNKS